MSAHISGERLQEYVDGVLPTDEQEQVTIHLRSCCLCKDSHEALVAVDQALRSLPVENVSPAFTRSVMEKLPLVRKAPVSFRILEKFASLFALFLVLAILATVFVLTGVVDLQQVNQGQTQLEEFLSGPMTTVGSGIAAFSNALAKYVPFAFGSGSIGITWTIVAVVISLALLDRIIVRRIIPKLR